MRTGRIEATSNGRNSKAFCFAFCAAFFALCVSAHAQQPKKVPRIGYLAASSATDTARIDAFRRGLREFGYEEGKNIVIDDRYADEKLDRLFELAADLVRLHVDVIVADGTNPSLAAKKATSTIPIVMVATTDPVANGLVASLARPGGNITGLVRAGGDSGKTAARFIEELLLASKRLALLKEVMPALSRVGILRDVQSAPTAAAWYSLPEVSQKLEIQYLDVQGPNPDFEAIFEAVVKAHVSALITVKTPLFKLYQKQIAELAAKNGIALMSGASDDAEAGSLMSYGWNEADEFHRVATYVDRILKGAKPADLPVETWPCVMLTVTPVGKAPMPYPDNCEKPTKLEIVINLKTAKQIGVTIPPNVLARADKVIR